LIAVAATLGVGSLMGVVARAMMRLVAVFAGEPVTFSLVNSLGVPVIFVAAMLPGAVLAVAWRGRGRWLLLVAGTVLLLVAGTGVASDELSGVGDLSIPQWLGVIISSVGVYACILAMPVILYRLLIRVAPRRDRTDEAIAAQ
jgi:hypothetical protein